MWRASSIDCAWRAGTPTGFAVLDRHLPGGGWPTDGIAEFMHDHQGIGELRLLVPALARLSREQTRWLLWVAPPYVPYAPALAQAGIDLAAVLVVRPKNRNDLLWVMEKAMASRSCSAVLAWPGNIHAREVRRLQVACKEGHCFGVLYRSVTAARHASPAELRVQLYGAKPSPLVEHSTLKLRILKRRGGWATDALAIDFADRLNQFTPDFSEMVIAREPLPASRLEFIDCHSPGRASRDFERR